MELLHAKNLPTILDIMPEKSCPYGQINSYAQALYVGNVVKVESIKGEVESSVDTKEENTDETNSCTGIVINAESLYQG